MRYRMSLLFLLIMGVALILPVRLANSEVLDANIRIDRTDFPALYLSKPELQGEAVWMLQARLRELGYYIEPNGVYNQATSDMIKIFQVANNLTVNGQVSRVEWETIMDMEESEPCLTQPEGESRIRIVIDIVKHSLTVFSDDQPIKKYAIGVGKSSTPSPLGDWKIVQKSYDWGNGFGTRWMGLNVPWGIYGIHGTNKPGSVGYSQSHGCIRMRNKDVEELFPQIPMGTWVRIVENGNIFPRAFNGKPLQIKSSGQNVVYLQNQLKQNGIIFDNADGRFGAMTELAVKYYQIWHGLKPTGKADTETYRSLGMIK